MPKKIPCRLPSTVLLRTLGFACLFLPAIGLSAADPVHQLGERVVLHAIDAPVIDNPSDWVGRPGGSSTFRFVFGSDSGKTTQVERHEPAEPNSADAWWRHIGESMSEEFVIHESGAVELHTQIDHSHGYRVSFSPGVQIPTGLEPGSEWHSANTLEVRAVDEPDKIAYRGAMAATHRYVGAFRVRVPAGEFDAILIEDDYHLRIGPLKADDTRHIFYAKGVGIVAEVEGLHASALIVFRVKDDSAKVLLDLSPEPDA